MPNTDLAPKILELLQNEGRKNVDRYEFTELDVLIGQLRKQGQPVLDSLDSGLRSIVSALAAAGDEEWSAFRSIVKQTGLHSVPLSEALEKLLDKPNTSLNPMARYWVLRTMIDAGGVLTMKVLNREDALKHTFPALWLDLASTVLTGSPRELANEYVAALRKGGLRWHEVRKRIPNLQSAFGTSEFLPCMKAILDALPEKVEREALAKAIKGYSGVSVNDAMPAPSAHVVTEPLTLPSSLALPSSKIIKFREPVLRAIELGLRYRKQRGPSQILAMA